ncbi:hypothetical protein [Flavobacterium sp.]|uniref:hypothetical protein n=1 Tax=Flavobacterium sp. TaxID=239 RepID=UPI0008AB8D18|nr:hypothetical protein [Flavobacterium sp.]OGS63157.1 MAG: hypothetical protein A2X07_06545 [Flavobacteria bacterium GWF1_32_7]HBD26694.1 hypothetical protein [Flavobacterium sp.]
MKKVVLSLAVVAAMFVSCKEAAAEAETVVDSTATEVTETVEAVADSTAAVVDSTITKVEETTKVELKKAEEVIKK